MAHHKDAIKRIRTSGEARKRNRAYRTRMRSEIKEVRAQIETGNAEGAAAALPEAVSILHKLAHKGVIHRRNAARRVARLAKAVNALKKP